jgi:hypothetical protein
MKISALALALCLALAGCDDVALSVVCRGEPHPSLVMSVFDAAGTAVTHQSQGWYTVGATTDSLRHRAPEEGVTQLVAFGPAGVYQLRVRAAGVPELRMPNVLVEDGDCGPATRYLDVQLPMGE